MAEMIDKWAVVNKLIHLENEYQFNKLNWYAETLYRKLCELEIEIGKTSGVELVRCKDCKKSFKNMGICCLRSDGLIGITENDFCSKGERKTDG